MTEKAKKYLLDIHKAIHLIEDFTQNISSFYDYQKDLKTKSAVERQLAIIGEATQQLKKGDSHLFFKKFYFHCRFTESFNSCL